MRRSLLLAAVAIVAAVATPASAEDAPRIPDALPKAPTTPYVLAGARFLEANVSVSTLMDSNARTDAPQDARTGRTSFVPGLDVGVPFANQRLRPSLFAGVQIGYWGDDVHGPVSAYLGARFRGSFYMDDIFDLYAVARGDFPISSGGAGFRPGLGFGLRVGRVVSLEATYDTVLTLGPSFQNTQFSSFVPIGFTISLMVDACMGCTRSAKQPVNRNMACRLYDLAKTVSTPELRKSICDAVPKAMEACPNPLNATREQDGAAVFLAALSDAVPADAKPAVARLVEMHETLLERWTSYGRVADATDAQGLKLAERWTYAPVPAELRDFLGCDDGPPPSCTEITPGG